MTSRTIRGPHVALHALPPRPGTWRVSDWVVGLTIALIVIGAALILGANLIR
jgi:hypothetical protein